ncbi:uncharacterized protein A1O5_12455 [Cladophialophora psammophila CBS 110553]|uniref:PH-response regulator protein palI/RIM9 n=1 Tax=Cladophialophora psammophila CBS 110553 TaxID=1182543 RepID=W9VY63_9EURO|nr:uncharacterized protein A1O5_12455 [Cladophialophora psammophila CBS 110553]EXJ57665.1 hypothetical protein A1O5_12455 [Cladophialophora psammophila CBS 110553]
MLRPATPLTVLLLISFVFLLLSVLSTPVIHSIPIATYQGVNFGVFGYCTPSKCSGIRVGYTTDGLFPTGQTDFNLPSSARHSLSSLLIVHPVAAFCNLVCLALAAAAHLHSPSHSARYLLGLLILLLPTLLVTLLAFLVDILLFVPHLQWAGWIVLASTILIAASGVVTCAMRRTLVSRKARKKRIAENAEMSGENFYNRQAQESKMVAETFTAEPTMPMVNGSPGADRLPTFATFDASQKSDEERQPLRAQALSNEPTLVTPSRDGASDRYYGPPSRSSSRPPYNGPRDQLGNPPPPPPPGPDAAMVPGQGRRSGDEPTPPSPYRDRSLPPPGGRGYPPRGRGNYPPRGGYPPRAGGFGPRAPPPPQGYPGRGGFSTDMRGGYGGRGRGGFPPGAPGGSGMAVGAMMGGGPRRPPPGYPPSGADSTSERYTPPDEYPVTMGPPLPMGPSQQYIEDNDQRYDLRSPSVYTQGGEELQGQYGASAQSPGRERTSPYGSRFQSPSGALRRPSPPPAMPPLPTTQPVEMAGTSIRDFNPRRSQSQDPYVPARANWNNMSVDDMGHPRSPGRHGQSPVELPTSGSHVGGYNGQPRRPRVNSGGSDVYYEDVDPRFASDPEPPMPQHLRVEERSRRPPPLLTPGPPGHYRPDSYNEIPPTNSYEELPGARSPAESENSNFTSVSQRGINPNWRPGNGGEFNSLGPARRRDHQTRQDMLLAGNPDFELPGAMGPPRLLMRGRGGSSAMRGGMMRGGPARIPPASAVGGSGDGPYPTPMGPPLPGGPMGPPGPGPGPGIAPGPGMGMGGTREI